MTMLPFPIGAVNPNEMLQDPTLEQEAREISKSLRCLVCQNQSIDDSDAKLAKDLRLLVRERLLSGSNREEILDYVVSRYGDFVLLKPPFKLETFILWVGPICFIIIGLTSVVLFYRRHRFVRKMEETTTKPLNENEIQRLQNILGDHKQ